MRKLMMTGAMALGLAVSPIAVHAETPAPAASATASTPAKVALVKRYFAAMHFDTMMSGLMRQMMPVMLAQTRKAHPEITDAQMQAVTDAASESMSAYMPKMVDAMVGVYADTFTEEELTRLVDFYESPTGQSIMAKTPQATQKMLPVMMQIMPEMQADMMKRMCAKVDCSAKKPG
ncbi:MAG: DUF2059 domain-containing protein [Asticcacaulis sp.]